MTPGEKPETPRAPGDDKLIDQICDRFEAAWLAGEQPQIEVFLAEVAASLRPRLLSEQLSAQWDLCFQADRKVEIGSYLARFPEDGELVGRTYDAWVADPRDTADFDRNASDSSLRSLLPDSDATQSQVLDNVERLAALASKSAASPFCDQVPIFENYEIIFEIARGGMGVVYKARQKRPNRLVAIKMIRSINFASQAQIKRFMTEAEAASQLDDEAVVPVYELGAVGGDPFIAMKYIDGDSLQTLLKRGEISTTAAIKLLVLVCRAVAGAHKRGIIHRDLKPSNIVVDRATERPWVTDFGLAKYLNRESEATADGDVMGTPGYMSPEQAAGDLNVVSYATDVYGLGAILYRILTGRPPIHSEHASLAQIVQLIREHDFRAPRSFDHRIPAELDSICMKCLETDADRRYADAGELADDLERFLDGEPIHAKPLGWSRRIFRWARYRPGQAATWCTLAMFYLFHRVAIWLKWYDDPGFDFAATLVAATAAAGAWYWQRCLIRSGGAPWVLYAWVTADLTLLTLLLFAGDCANSELVLLYHVIVAASVLRCRPALVAYVTCLATVGYGVQLAYLQLSDATRIPPLTTIVPTLLSVLVIGIIQYLSLRRSAISLESQAAEGTIVTSQDAKRRP